MIYKFLEYINSTRLSIYFLVPTSYSFGNCCEQIKLAALECKKKKKKLYIVIPKISQKFLKYKISNDYLLNNIIINENESNVVIYPFNKKSFIYIVISGLLNLEFFLRRSTALFLRFFFKINLKERNFSPVVGLPKFISNDKSVIIKENILKQNFEGLKINIEKDKEEFCKKILHNLGINQNIKFVCLHLRDGQYKNDYNRRPERNIDIKNYYQLIKYLLSKNYFVIRIGQNQKDKVKIKNKEFIDYPFSEIKSDFMDLYLIKNCKFFIGNLSGPLEAAYMFDKPCLALDVNKVFESFPRGKYSRSVFTNVFYKNSKQKIPFKEFVNLDIKYHHWKFIDNSIEYKNLKEEEILEEIKSYQLLIEKNQFYLENTQIKFNNYILNNLIKKINNLKEQTRTKSIVEDIEYYNKMVFFLKNSQGSFSENFLKKNDFVIN